MWRFGCNNVYTQAWEKVGIQYAVTIECIYPAVGNENNIIGRYITVYLLFPTLYTTRLTLIELIDSHIKKYHNFSLRVYVLAKKKGFDIQTGSRSNRKNRKSFDYRLWLLLSGKYYNKLLLLVGFTN